MRTTRVANLKQQILSDEGYRYSFDRELYFNRDAKKAFSVAFIEDHSEDELAGLIRDDSPEPGWHFFFTQRPSAAVQQKLIDVLE